MNKTKIGLLLLSACLLALWGCGGKAMITGFDFAGYKSNLDQVSKQHIAVNNPKDLQNSIVKKVAISEFNLEFLVDLENESLHKQLVDECYNIFVNEVSAATGWEFAPKDSVIASPVYQSMNKQDRIEGGGYQKKGGYAYTTDTVIYPPTGMGILKIEAAKGLKALKGAFKGMGNVNKEAGVLDDVGADAAFKIHVIAFIHDDKKVKNDIRACITPGVAGLASTSKTELHLGVNKGPGGLIGVEGPDGVKYVYSYKGMTSFTLISDKKNPGRIISSINCKPEKGRGILIKEFMDGYKEAFTAYSKMVGQQIKLNM
ncbi:MAG: hypothetical protein ABIA75_04765 [Candidatus Neomarinimicrobiota bacterium]